jgi:hypothetical protein
MNAKPPKERESKIQRSIVVRLERLGVKLWRRNVGGMTDSYGHHVRFASPGMADLWGVDRNARHWEIETKRPGNRPTPKQLEWLKGMTARGCVAYWADSANDSGAGGRGRAGGGPNSLGWGRVRLRCRDLTGGGTMTI